MKPDKRFIILSLGLTIIAVSMLFYYVYLLSTSSEPSVSVSDTTYTKAEPIMATNAAIVMDGPETLALGATEQVTILFTPEVTTQAVSVTMDYDPSVFSVEDLVINGSLFELVAKNRLDNVNGLIQFDMATVRDEGVSEGQVLGYFSLTRKVAGASELQLRTFDQNTNLQTPYSAFITTGGIVYAVPEHSLQVN